MRLKVKSETKRSLMRQDDGILSYTYEIKHNYVVKIEIRTCGKKSEIMRKSKLTQLRRFMNLTSEVRIKTFYLKNVCYLNV